MGIAFGIFQKSDNEAVTSLGDYVNASRLFHSSKKCQEIQERRQAQIGAGQI